MLTSIEPSRKKVAIGFRFGLSLTTRLQVDYLNSFPMCCFQQRDSLTARLMFRGEIPCSLAALLSPNSASPIC